MHIFKALTDLQSLQHVVSVIEAKLSNVGPSLQNRKVAFIYRDLVLQMAYVILGTILS